MPQTSARVAIIGAGTAGCGAARRAAELGAKSVVLIDKATPASGSSGRSAGVYNVQTLRPLDIEIRIRARELLFRLERERGLPLHRIGVLRMARTQADLRRCEEAVEYQRSLGVTDARVIDQSEIRRRVPHLECSDVLGALHGPNDGSLDGHLVCSTLIDEARDLGARLMAHTSLLGHRCRGNAHVLETSKGELECDIVINAAGAWASQIGLLLGHPAPIAPEVHEVVRVKLPKALDYTVPFVNFYMPGSTGEAVYFRQEGVDLIAGMHTYGSVPGLLVNDPDNYSPPDSDEYLITVAEQVTARLKIDDLGFRAGWYGIYPLSKDGEFQVGPYADDPSVLVVAGLGGVGVTTGPTLGALAAEWALLGKPITVPDAACLLPDRPSLTQ